MFYIEVTATTYEHAQLHFTLGAASGILGNPTSHISSEDIIEGLPSRFDKLHTTEPALFTH
jgi:hypothetical protein